MFLTQEVSVFWKISVALVLLMSSVCKADDIDIFCYNTELKAFVPWQKHEIAKRFKRANVIFCHGGYINGVWFVFPEKQRPKPVQRVIDHVLKIDHTKPLILLVCNEEGQTVYGNNVWYFKSDIWAVPDDKLYCTLYDKYLCKYRNSIHEANKNLGAAGSIWEAVPATH